jgi:CTP-dependent riboflavin kinase
MADSAILIAMEQQFGMALVPGTLNLVLAHHFDRPPGTLFVPSVELGPDWEETTGQAGYYLTPVLIEDRYRGVAMQAEEVGFPLEQVEIMSEVHLRSALNLDDGDEVRFSAVEGPRT